MNEDVRKQQRRASEAYRRALKSGQLLPAKACELCNKVCRTVGHHWRGYEDAHALDVQWLCISCHNRVHSARLGGLAGGPAYVAKVSIEKRREIARKAGLASMALLASEQRSELARKGGVAAMARNNPVEMGSRGGLRAMAQLTPEQRSERGRQAARARWSKKLDADTFTTNGTESPLDSPSRDGHRTG